MSEAAKAARSAMKSKAERLTKADPSQKVDSSTWSPPEPENAGVKTGARPLVKRLYKKGGKVIGKAEGSASKARADRVARKSGGRTEAERSKRYLTPDNLINRDVRMANDVREGKKHVGAFKKGGKVHKFGGGDVVGDNPVSVQSRSMGKAAGMMKKGGRAHHATKGKVNPMTQDRMPRNIPAGEMVPASQADWNRDLKNPEPMQTEAQRVGRAASMADKSIDTGDVALMNAANKYYDKTRQQAGEMKKGGKVKNWEGSKKDEAQDRLLAKKYGISMKEWEKSDKDEKHDKQQSMEGLKKGGRTAKYSGGGVFSGSSYPGKVPGVVGGREAHKKGGKAGKTNINIVIAAGHKPADMGAPNAPVPAPKAVPVPPPMPGAAMPAGGMPPMPPAGPQGMPPMPRKSGGRTTHVIDHAAGGGLGRMEKIKAYGHKAGKVVGKK